MAVDIQEWEAFEANPLELFKKFVGGQGNSSETPHHAWL